MPIEPAEKKFMRYVRGYIKADKIRNETIRLDLNIIAINMTGKK